MKERTDKERLDGIQWLTRGYGKGWVLRDSESGRGLRLHETSLPTAEYDVRKAIDKFLDEKEKDYVKIMKEKGDEKWQEIVK